MAFTGRLNVFYDGLFDAEGLATIHTFLRRCGKSICLERKVFHFVLAVLAVQKESHSFLSSSSEDSLAASSSLELSDSFASFFSLVGSGDSVSS